MQTKSSDDPVIEKILLGNNHVTPKVLSSARKFRDQYHPEKDLAEVLFQKGHLTRARLALVRRLVKMNRRGDSASMPRPITELGADDASEAPTEPRGSSSTLPKALTKCGRYELVEKIARGGMGVIYQARHPELDKSFAVKILSDGADAGPEAIERFRREAKTAARLDHPGIVKVYDAGTEAGFPYLVMQYVEGRSLEDVLRDEGVAPRHAAQVTLSISEALEYAHRHEVVHRDIKPANVLIDGEGRTKITDFGIVKELTADGKLTRTGFTLGSPCYMSPEQASGDHDKVGPASDVYSAAASLYEMLCGRPPFTGQSIHAIMRQVVDDDVVPPRHLNPLVPIELECICLKGLEKELSLRYPTALALGEDLRRFLAGEPVEARPAGALTRLWRSTRRNKLPVIMSALLFMTILCAGGLIAWNRLSTRAARQARSEELIRDARAELSAIRKTQPEPEIRRHFYLAITRFGEALQLAPGSGEVRRERARAITALGDRLLERGLAEFAEFVYLLNESVDPEVQKKLKVARQRSWIKAAEGHVRRGDLAAAIRTYQGGIVQLKQAGFRTEFFLRKVTSLEAIVGDEARRKKRDKVLIRAAEKERNGDELGALELYREAKGLGDDDGDLEEKITRLQKEINRTAQELSREAVEARRRFMAALGKGATTKASEALISEARERGDRALGAGHAAKDKGRFRDVMAFYNEAAERYRAGYHIAAAAVAKDSLVARRREAEAVQAERFAAKSLSSARTLEQQADARFKRRDFTGALTLYERASAAYVLATARSQGRGTVAKARQEAKKRAEEAVAALPPGLIIKSLKRARSIESEADAAYALGDFDGAETSYKRVTLKLLEIIKLGPLIQKAAKARKDAAISKANADAVWAELYGADFFERAMEVFREGEAEFGLEHFSTALDDYESAVYRFRRAISKAQPTASSRKKAETAKARMEDIRKKALAEGRSDSYAYIRAEKDRATGESKANKGIWQSARRYWDRAADAYQESRRR